MIHHPEITNTKELEEAWRLYDAWSPMNVNGNPNYWQQQREHVQNMQAILDWFANYWCDKRMYLGD